MSLYQQQTDHCFEDKLEGHGASKSAFDKALAALAAPMADVASRKNKEAAPLLDIVSKTDELGEIEAYAETLRTRFKHFVVAGTGGSGASGRTLLALKPCAEGCFHFLDNIDPETMEACLESIDVESSFFLIISKSGSTVETLSQFYVLLEHVKKLLGKNAVAERFAVITMNTPNPMRATAQEYGIRILEHPPTIGGRFSIFTSVGLLPAAIAGLDIRALRSGAASVVKALENAKSPKDSMPAIGAALHYALLDKSVNMNVLMPYSERLEGLTLWYRQSWAESLGKDGKGTTPLPAVGSTDQHSQLQLYLGGPHDKFITLVTMQRAGTGPAIVVPDILELAYMRGKTMGDILGAEQKATFETLVHNHRPVRVIEINTLGEAELGALIMHFTLEIIFMGALLNVNPFDQPAVEEGKELARRYLLAGKP